MTKLYAFFVSETTTPDPDFINQLATIYLQNDTAIAPVRAILLDVAAFQDPSNFFTRYSWPAEFVDARAEGDRLERFSVAAARCRRS